MHPKAEIISDYVDGALGAAGQVDVQAEVEAHLASCAACRGLAEDLRALARAAADLRTVEPPATAWRRGEKAIHAEIAAHPRRVETPRRFASWTWLAAAAVLALATIVGVRMARAPADGRPLPATATSTQTSATQAAAPADSAQSVETELREAEEHYDKAITGLEQIANANQGALDPGTAATLHKNLAVIDQAISESRAAVHAQPNSEPAQQSLLENFRTKVSVLQDTVALINEMRKGNDTGAARIVSGLKDKGE
jgi:hypothetical protein